MALWLPCTDPCDEVFTWDQTRQDDNNLPATWQFHGQVIPCTITLWDGELRLLACDSLVPLLGHRRGTL